MIQQRELAKSGVAIAEPVPSADWSVASANGVIHVVEKIQIFAAIMPCCGSASKFGDEARQLACITTVACEWPVGCESCRAKEDDRVVDTLAPKCRQTLKVIRQ